MRRYQTDIVADSHGDSAGWPETPSHRQGTRFHQEFIAQGHTAHMPCGYQQAQDVQLRGCCSFLHVKPPTRGSVTDESFLRGHGEFQILSIGVTRKENMRQDLGAGYNSFTRSKVILIRKGISDSWEIKQPSLRIITTKIKK